MKPIVDHLIEAIELNEAKSIFDGIETDFDEDNIEIMAPDSISMINGIADDLENVKVNDLKKIRDWKDYSKDKLEDYCKIVEEIAAWIRGIISQAEDYLDEAGAYIAMIEYLPDEYQPCLENVSEVVDGLKSLPDGGDVYDYVEDVLVHWNEVSKAILGKPWN